jgi:hypothetical protein
MHKPSVAKTPTVKTASIMLPSTESGLPLDGRKPKYSQSLAVQVTIITVETSRTYDEICGTQFNRHFTRSTRKTPEHPRSPNS